MFERGCWLIAVWLKQKTKKEGEAREVFEAFGRYQRKAARALILRFARLPRRWVQRSLTCDALVIRQWIQGVIEERLAQPEAGHAPVAALGQDL